MVQTSVAALAAYAELTAALLEAHSPDPMIHRAHFSALIPTVTLLGASDCAPCNVPENIHLVRQVKARLPSAYPDLVVKFVLVYLDHDFDRAREFAGKYGVWDEISIGSVWFNELAQLYLASSKAAAIPHVMVFSDSDAFDPVRGRGHYLKRTLLVGDYIVGPELNEWLQHGVPLWHLDTLIGDADSASPRFAGRWRSSKERNADQAAELLELTVVPTNAPGRFRLELLEDGEPSSAQCSDAILSPPRKLTFTAQEDSTTATGECVLSLDARHMRLALAVTNWMEQTMILERIAE